MSNYLESQIDKLIKRINENRAGYGWKNHPFRNYEGTYVDGEVFDYIILTKEKTFCFDCKQTELIHWHIKAKDIKQALNLNKIADLGYDAFFLIYFIYDKKLMKIDVKNVLKILSDRKYIAPTDCCKFDLSDIIKS